MMKSVGVVVVVVLLMALSAVHAYVALPMRSRTFENLENAAKRRRSSLETAALSGCPSSDFSVEVTLGSSGQTQTFELIVDTGSSTLAVAGDSCCGTTSSYTTSLHTTAVDSGVQVTSTYGDGSGWTGTVYTDTVDVGGVTVSGMKIAVQTSQNSFYNPSCSSSTPFNQGIMGMAYETLAVSSGSTTTDAFPNKVEASAASSASAASVLSGTNNGLVFGLQMCATTGQLFLGPDSSNNGYGLATTAPVYVPITQQVWYVINLNGMSIGSTALPTDFGTTIVDSGTTQLVVPQDVLTKIESVVNANSVFASVFGSGFLSGSECKSSTQTTAQLNAALPTLTFNLDNGLTLTVPAINSYLQQVGTGSSAYYCPGIGAGSGTTILGWSFINNFVVIFDRTTTHGSLGAIGIAPTTSCGSTATSTGGSTTTSAPTTAGSTKAPTVAPTTPVVYNWQAGTFGFCSVTCGGGTETRTVTCVSNTGVVDTTNTKCSASTKPSTTQTCNTQACTTAAPVGTSAPASPSATSCALRCGTYSATATCNCDSYCTYYKDCCSDLSTVCAATTAPVATVKATTAPTVSGATAKPTTPKVSATANPALCLSAGVNNCGVYSPTRSCECDSLCTYYGDCCSDYNTNCASGSLGFDSLYSRRNGTLAGSGSKSDARALSASLFTIFAALAFLFAML